MKAPLPGLLVLIAIGVLPVAAQAADAEGCADLKLLSRLQGCAIVECSAKQHDSFDSPDVTAGSLEVNTNSLTYSCPASMDVQRIKRELESAARKAGYLSVNEDKSDPDNPVVTARKGSHWLRWGVSSDDGENGYSLTEAQPATEKFKPDACAQPPFIPSLQHCELLECASKSEDSVTMHSANGIETPLAGTVRSTLLSCPSNPSQQLLSAAADELQSSGYEILFSDHEHPETGWVTARAGKQWIEIATVQEADSMSYAVTVVPSAEVLTATKDEPPAVEAPHAPEVPAIIAPPPSPQAPANAFQGQVAASDPRLAPPAPSAGSLPSSISTATLIPQRFSGGFVPPKPLVQAAIDPTHERIYSVMGEVVINILVDVDESGSVTHAELTGRITKDVLKLQDAALEAASRWRFEPARQDGRTVAAVKIPIQMRFHGRPWRF